MNMDNKAVLVGVDGTDASYKAVWWAANYAKHAGLTLQIVCAYSLPSYAAVSFDATYTALGDDAVAHTDAQEILSRAKAIADEQGVDASTLIVTGDPSSVFVELSRNYNLIVIGNRGKGGLAERLLGTTSSSLPAYAYCPIVVVPFTDDEDKLLHLNNVITRVVVGSDESKWGLKALEIAADFANSWDADLTVLSAVPVYGASGGVFSMAPSKEDTDRIIDSYLDDLKVRVEPIQKQYPDLVIRTEVVPGSAVDTLTQASASNDVVVVGSRGRGGFTGLILGSTSQGLIQHATSPVYVVPRKYVEAAEREMDTVPHSPADVPSKALEEITGVQRIEVPTGSHQQAEEIDTAIDPLRPNHDDSHSDHSDETAESEKSEKSEK
ncbi:MAG: universal stress protein [Bifidobacteriaceae bacterium]|jgi:nucleotide-binding universal stress UspA family protein|nr:universal stress protein [Bifidobacteriaceae bacterium]MCI1914603.1 universal stress protein [Bifidobacteriaceae bacterium]